MNKIRIGDKVKVIDKYSRFNGRIGVVYFIDTLSGLYYVCMEYGDYLRFWPDRLEKIKNIKNEDFSSMTDTEIARMVDKTHILEAEEGRILTEHGLKDCVSVNMNDIITAIALAYKKGYLRAKKERPFKIGDKKCK